MLTHYREAHNVKELEALFPFCYRTLWASTLSGLVPATKGNLHMEHFDQRAHHNTLYLQDDREREVIGYLRVVVKESGLHRDAGWEIDSRHRALGPALMTHPGVPFARESNSWSGE